MTRLLRVVLLGASLVGTLGVSGCYVERQRHHDYYGRHEWRCHGDECHERRHW